MTERYCAFSSTLLVVDVAQEHVERAHALREPALEALPVRRRDDPRHDVERDHALGARVLAVDREGDADALEEDVRLLPLLDEIFGRELVDPVGVGPVVGQYVSGEATHLVEEELWVGRHGRGGIFQSERLV